MLNKIREALGIWRTELNKLEAELEKKLQRLAYLQEAPLPAEELADTVVAQMLRHSEVEFHRHLDLKLSHAVNNPISDMSNDLWWPGLMANVTTPNALDPRCLFYLLREPLGEAVREEIKLQFAMSPAGPPQVERQKEIAKLEKDIPKLQRQIESSRQEAAAVGVDAGDLHQRCKIPTRPRDIE